VVDDLAVEVEDDEERHQVLAAEVDERHVELHVRQRVRHQALPERVLGQLGLEVAAAEEVVGGRRGRHLGEEELRQGERERHQPDDAQRRVDLAAHAAVQQDGLLALAVGVADARAGDGEVAVDGDVGHGEDVDVDGDAGGVGGQLARARRR